MRPFITCSFVLVVLRWSPPTWLRHRCSSSELSLHSVRVPGRVLTSFCICYLTSLSSSRLEVSSSSFQKNTWHIVDTQFVFVKIIPAFYCICLVSWSAPKGTWKARRHSLNECGPAPGIGSCGRSWAVSPNASVVNSMLLTGLFPVIPFICPQLLTAGVTIPYWKEKRGLLA